MHTYLDQGVRSCRALFFVAGVEVGGKIAAGPSRRIGAIEAQGIAIVAVNINRTLTSSGSIVTTSPSIVVDERNYDSSRTGMVLNVLHVRAVREVINTTASTRVLVLRLVQNDWATVGDLCLGNCGSNVRGVAEVIC